MENHGPLHLEHPSIEDTQAYYSQPPPKNSEDLTVYLKHLKNADLMIDIFNISGQKVKAQKINLNKGSHILSFDSTVLPHGVYLISITSGDRKIIETRKFVK